MLQSGNNRKKKERQRQRLAKCRGNLYSLPYMNFTMTLLESVSSIFIGHPQRCGEIVKLYFAF
jgi:hypothetical protein